MKGKKKASGAGGRYSKTESKGFSDFITEEEEKDMNVLVKEIIETGNSFSRSPSQENLESYKKKIKLFLKLIEKRLYTITGVTSIENRRAKLYFIVDKVNKEFEDLSKKIFDSERSTIYFAARVSEINGLIMDLYL